MILAVEVAKLVSFGQLYELLIRVCRQIMLGENGGLQYVTDILQEVFFSDPFFCNLPNLF